MVGIYKITNKINNKIYIGQSTNIEVRLKQHHTEPFNINSSQYDGLLYRAIRKYGIDNFYFEIIETCTIEELDEKERYWINYYQSYIGYGNNGYNMTIGGQAGSRFFNADILKLWEKGCTGQQIADKYNISKSLVYKYLRYNGIPIKEIIQRANKYKAKSIIQYSLKGEFVRQYDTITKAVEALQEIGFSSAATQNIILACQHKLTTAYNYLWKYAEDPITVEELIKLANSKLHHRNRAVKQYTLQGQYIQTFNTISEAARVANIKTASAITNCCTGFSKSSGGFIWKYADE